MLRNGGRDVKQACFFQKVVLVRKSMLLDQTRAAVVGEIAIEAEMLPNSLRN
jgi:hypothetical protein